MKAWRSKKYLKHAARYCRLCGNNKAVAHHIKGVGNLSGVGLKAPDWATFGVCAEHHAKIHEMRNKNEQWFFTACTLVVAIKENVLQVEFNRDQEFVLAIGKLIEDGVLVSR